MDLTHYFLEILQLFSGDFVNSHSKVLGANVSVSDGETFLRSFLKNRRFNSVDPPEGLEHALKLCGNEETNTQ
jgi:hypothetical protein